MVQLVFSWKIFPNLERWIWNDHQVRWNAVADSTCPVLMILILSHVGPLSHFVDHLIKVELLRHKETPAMYQGQGNPSQHLTDISFFRYG